MEATPPPDFVSDAWSRRLMMADGCSRSRQDARRLEAKVAKVATKKCSVEEVTTLHKELQEWLMSDPKPDDEVGSFPLLFCRPNFELTRLGRRYLR